MADPDPQQQQQQQQQNKAATLSAFPAPPPFYKHFSPDNLERLKELQEVESTSAGAPADIPPELRFLVPPVPPETGNYRCFNDIYHIEDTLPSLSASQIEQLYPSTPPPSSNNPAPSLTPERNASRAFYLTKIAQSLLLNFLELVGILSVDPSQYAPKIHDLRTLFLNAHHLLNEYRPHQARESLALRMQEQLDRCRAETRAIRDAKARVEAVLENLRSEVEEGAEEADTTDGQKSKGLLGEEERVWQALREI
ncbi:MAG: Mediator of RNA polymerase II transcription subunit 7 [Thelocarpon impressellum]|nr:MAG: Mediator of RNA polymerase II transcription subunit 7 [Thelocarpon impressellum]